MEIVYSNVKKATMMVFHCQLYYLSFIKGDDNLLKLFDLKKRVLF